jgi:hypothetical protein
MKVTTSLIVCLGISSWLSPLPGLVESSKALEALESQSDALQMQQFLNQTTEQGMNRPLVEMAFIGFLKVSKFPEQYLTYDVTLRNPHAEPRWFLLPRRGTRLPPLTSLRLRELNILKLADQGKLWICELYYHSSYYNSLWAIKLSAQTEVKLRRYDFASFTDPNNLADEYPREAAIGKQLLINGMSYESTMRLNLTSDANADVTETSIHLDTISHREIPGEETVLATLVDEQRIKLPGIYPTAAPD